MSSAVSRSRQRRHPSFQLVSRRYERGGMLITSNRSIGDGARSSASGGGHRDARTACCIIAQVITIVITIRGDSYRLRENAAPVSSKRRNCTRSGSYEAGLPRRVHRNLPRSAPPAARRPLRSARVPPMDCRDKPSHRPPRHSPQAGGSVLRVARGPVPDVVRAPFPWQAPRGKPEQRQRAAEAAD